MLLEVLMQYSGKVSHQLSPIERRFRDIQIVIITNFVIVSSVGIKRVDCSISVTLPLRLVVLFLRIFCCTEPLTHVLREQCSTIMAFRSIFIFISCLRSPDR